MPERLYQMLLDGIPLVSLGNELGFYLLSHWDLQFFVISNISGCLIV